MSQPQAPWAHVPLGTVLVLCLLSSIHGCGDSVQQGSRPAKPTTSFSPYSNDEMRQFRAYVVQLIKEGFPGVKVQEGTLASELLLDEARLSLDNVYRLASQAADESERRMLVVEFLSTSIPTIPMSREPPESWKDAKPLIRVQLIPVELVEELQRLDKGAETPSGGPIVEMVAPGLYRAAMFDLPYGMMYLQQDQARAWGVPFSTVLSAGSVNLGIASTSAPWNSILTDSLKILEIQPVDSYEAARITLPKIRKFVSEHLGSPFYFGVSDRQSLIAWSTDTKPATRSELASQVSSDFMQRPHPISPHVFLATEGEISLFSRFDSTSGQHLQVKAPPD